MSTKVQSLSEYRVAKRNVEKIPNMLKALKNCRRSIVDNYNEYDEVAFLLGTIWDVESLLMTRLTISNKVLDKGK
jgi:hypothetical protein